MKKTTHSLIAAGKTGTLVPVVTAHSGSEGTPDNSIEHVRAAIASGAEYCEVDIYAHDGILYLTHDEPKDYSACVTLEECFALAKGEKMGFNCDMKRDGNVPLVLELARKYALEDRIVFTGSLSEDDVSALDASVADRWVNTNDGESPAKCMDRLDAEGKDYRMLNLHFHHADSELFEITRQRGYGLSLWTVNDEESIRRVMISGAMNVTTRRPVLALRVRKELFGK